MESTLRPPCSRRPRLWFGLGAFAALLLTSAGIQFANLGMTRPSSRPTPILAAALPESVSGWTARELPIAETEELRNAVADTLRFDDQIGREYRRADRVVSIYIAYWASGKVPPRMVGVHTPDTCWIQNGWTRSARARDVPLQGAIGPLKAAQSGTYHSRGSTQYVLFWHLVGGQPYAYEQEGLHDVWAPLRDFRTFGLNQKREQFFIRLSANSPWDTLWQDPGIRELIGALETLALSERG